MSSLGFFVVVIINHSTNNVIFMFQKTDAVMFDSVTYKDGKDVRSDLLEKKYKKIKDLLLIGKLW